LNLVERNDFLCEKVIMTIPLQKTSKNLIFRLKNISLLFVSPNVHLVSNCYLNIAKIWLIL
jgi:hypothetical protein